MKKIYTNQTPNVFDEKVNIHDLFNVLSERRWLVISVTAFISTIGVIYSLALPNIYESKALLTPTNSDSNISRTLGSYSSLAGLAGVNLPSNGDEGNSVKAIKKLTSLSFFENNLVRNIHLPNLMALKAWDSKTNTILFDENIYDINSNTWVRKYSYPQKQIPSAQESFKVFTEEHFSLSEDKKSGFITLSIRHQSPYVAKYWVELLVNEINNFYRQKDRSESEKAISYLNQQISKNSLSEIKQAIAQLLQEETKTLALIEANQFYVFDYIDPPAVMEKKAGPKRALICIFAFIIGGLLGILLAFFKSFRPNLANVKI